MSECCIVFSDCIFLLLPLAWVTTMKLKTIRTADVSCKLLRVTLWILHKTNFSVLSHFLKFIYLHEVFIYAIHFLFMNTKLRYQQHHLICRDNCYGSFHLIGFNLFFLKKLVINEIMKQWATKILSQKYLCKIIEAFVISLIFKDTQLSQQI